VSTIEDRVTHWRNSCQTHPTSYSALLVRCRGDGGFRYNCILQSRLLCRTLRDMPNISFFLFIHFRVRSRIGLQAESEVTCKTLRARRISPLDSFNNAAFPSSVRLHLNCQLTTLLGRFQSRTSGPRKGTYPSFSTTSSTLRCTSFSGNGENLNLVQRD
jgi:hypothetical protein